MSLTEIGQLFINECSAEELSEHPKISSELARQIVAERGRGGAFVHWKELAERVDGVPENFRSSVEPEVQLTSSEYVVVGSLSV